MSSGAPTIGGLKRLSLYLAGQLKSAVSITGGSISGVTLGLASGQKGTFTANGSTAVVVSNTTVTADSVIVITLKTVGGTPAGAPYLSAITASTGFSVKAAVGDTSVYNYAIIG